MAAAKRDRQITVRTRAKFESKHEAWRRGPTALGVALAISLAHSQPVFADLNEYEAAAGADRDQAYWTAATFYKAAERPFSEQASRCYVST